MARAPSLFPRLSRQEKTQLNQLLWARQILRKAPAELARHADMIEQFSAAADLPERGAHHAQPKGRQRNGQD